MNLVIKSIQAFSEYDSRGDLTISGTLVLSNGQTVEASIPNTLSKNKKAGVYLENSKALKFVNDLLAPKLVDTNPLEYKKIDRWLIQLDTSERKEIFGVNTILLISELIYRAGAVISNQPLPTYLNKIYNENFEPTKLVKMPTPIFSMISGGKHGSVSLNFQEFSILFSTQTSYEQALVKATSLHHELAKVFEYRNIFSGVGNDGAYVPNLSSNYDALEIIKEAILRSKLKIGADIFFALDVASTYFYKSGKYYLSEDVGSLDQKSLMEFYEKIFKEYRFLILEDPFVEDDEKGWKMAMEKFGKKAYLLGDDLLSMNSKSLTKAVKSNLCSMANIKIFQRGTIWEVLEFIAAARKGKLKIVLSQSAIETNDSFIADLAVGVQVDFVKFGAPVRGERVIKQNRMLAIERELFNG